MNMNGMDLLKTLKNPRLAITITAYREYSNCPGINLPEYTSPILLHLEKQE